LGLFFGVDPLKYSAYKIMLSTKRDDFTSFQSGFFVVVVVVVVVLTIVEFPV
jgi:hypothetical protein